jgi:hypothetical protein
VWFPYREKVVGTHPLSGVREEEGDVFIWKIRGSGLIVVFFLVGFGAVPVGGFL